MMLNKIAAIATAGAMIFSISGLALANNYHHDDRQSNGVEITNEHTRVLNVSGTVANTGLNSQTGSWGAKQTLGTGVVSTLSSSALSDVNSTIVAQSCNCSRGDLKVKNERTSVANVALTVGNTGLNRQSGSLFSNQTTGTGSVDSLSSNSQTSVNYTDFSVN